MKFAVLGDIHGSIGNVRIIQKKLKKCNAVFITGDISGTISYPLIIKSVIRSKRVSREKYAELVYGKYLPEFVKFQKKTTDRIFKFLENLEVPVFYTHGNSDSEEIRNIFNQISDDNPLMYYIGNSLVRYDDWLVVGYGYSSPAEYRTPFQTPGEKQIEEIREDLSNLVSKASNYKNENINLYIGVFHEPPYNTKTDFMPHKNTHGGSELIRDHITKIPYSYVFSGHIHESQDYEYMKQTLLLNPGPLVNKQWALVDHTNSKVELQKIPISFSTRGLVYRTRDTFK